MGFFNKSLAAPMFDWKCKKMVITTFQKAPKRQKDEKPRLRHALAGARAVFLYVTGMVSLSQGFLKTFPLLMQSLQLVYRC